MGDDDNVTQGKSLNEAEFFFYFDHIKVLTLSSDTPPSTWWWSQWWKWKEYYQKCQADTVSVP